MTTSGESWWPRSDGAPPLFATRRNPLRPSDGPQVAVIAKALGTPFIPWQRYVADVAGERRPDGSFEYQIVIVSVPRQTGKTTLVRAEGVHTCLVCGRDFFYTAQTGKDARERWMDLVKVLRVHPAFRDRIEVGLRGGSEQVRFDDGGAFRVFAPTPESLHGYTPPKVAIDEAFAQTGDRGDLLMGAIGPAQITIIDKQIWIISTMGTAESEWFHDWLTRGSEGMPRVAVFWWGCPDDLDPFSLDDIPKFHPGVGFELNNKILTAQDVLDQADRHSRAEYERAFANRKTMTLAHLIPPDVLRPLGDPPSQLPETFDDVTISYDVARDRKSSTIMANWIGDDGRPSCRVIAAAPGLTWLPDALERISDERQPADIVAVDNGPVLEVTKALTGRGIPVITLAEREFATACGAFLTLVETGQLRHDGSEHFELSVCGLVTRPGAVDGVAFSRRHSVGDASAGIAAAAGLWVATNADEGEVVLDFSA